MKHFLDNFRVTCRAALLTLLAAAGLSAQSVSIAEIEQVGQNNRSTQTQQGENSAYILQRNVYANEGSQRQWGLMNTAVIIQKNTFVKNTAVQEQYEYGNRAAIVQENGSGNSGYQYQSGVNNKGNGAAVTDPVTGGSHNPEGYGAYLHQTGSSCSAVQRQIGNDNYNYIRQEGVNQQAEVNQYGAGLNHVLIQEASYTGPGYSITQTGDPLLALPRPAIIVRQR